MSQYRKYTKVELDAALIHLVPQATSFRNLIKNLNLPVDSGGIHATIEERVTELAIDTSHFTGSGWNKGKPGRSTAIYALADVLIENSPYKARGRLKQRLIKAGLLPNKCAICGLGPEWKGELLVLRLDHINGKNSDYRIENLRLLCPNCDSQTPTFTGRNTRRARLSREKKTKEAKDAKDAGSRPPNCSP